MQRRSLGQGTCIVALAWLLGTRASAMPVTLVADTHVNTARPAVNSGGISNINVGGGYTGLLQFDLSGLPAGTSAAQVSRAVLRLYVNQVTSAGTMSVAPLLAPWSEFGVTYQTMPALGGTAATFSISHAGAYITVDVTALVDGWLASPASNQGVALMGVTAVAQFDSKENDLTGHAPALDVDLLGQAGAPGPAGLAGPVGAMGPAGAMGPYGTQGVAGPAGTVGAVGSLGPVGAQGIAGSAGAVGPVGRQGIAGAPGTPGAPGPAGVSGPVGAMGPMGTSGPVGAMGPAGAAGPPGTTGPAGAQGLAGPAGPPVSFRGAWSVGPTYAVGDAVSFAGSSYAALSSNSGQQPGQSPGVWTLLAQAGTAGTQGPAGLTGATGATGATGLQGSAGPVGASGASGPAGLTGPAGPQGVAGATGAKGPAGALGMTFRGAWTSGYGYVANDAVTYGGSTWLTVAANNSAVPDSNPSSWVLLAAAGGAGATGPSGPSGSAATIAVGTVTTGAAGSSASVVNSGTSAAAVLNFTLPQGAAGAGGTGTGPAGTSGIPFASMYHAVSYAATYYALNDANQSLSETAAVLTWVPGGCSASKLVVYSQQAGTITVTLRYGTPGTMVNSKLTCQAAPGQSCTATGAESIPAGSFADLEIDHADSNPVGVWTAVSCN